MHPPPTIVVGAGLAGLAAATWLARAGRRVLVVEATEPGGRATTDRVDGHRFERGAHALYRSGAAARHLADLGVPVHGRAADPAATRVWIGDQLHPLPARPDQWVTARWLGGRAATLAGLWRLGASAFGDTSAADAIRGLPDGARRLAAALLRLSSYTGDLDHLPAAVALRQLRAAMVGVTYVDGGFGALVDGLRARADAAGVVVLTRTAARAVTAGAVTLDGETLPADAVVLAVPPQRASRLLGQPIAAPPPAEVAALQLAVRADALGDPRPRLILGDDPPVYLSWAGQAGWLGPHPVLHAIHYTPHKQAREVLEACLDAHAPRWRSGVVAARYLPRIASTAACPRVGQPRPGPRIVDGVYGCGDGWHADGLLADAALDSARRAVDSLLADRASCAA